jgi:hypothetical protein
MRKLTFFIFCLAIGLSACNKQITVSPTGAIDLTLDTASLTVGQTIQLTSKNYSSNQLNWNSSDTAIVSVSVSGLLSAKKIGQATIKVTNKPNTVSATCVVLVTQPITGTITQVTGQANDIGVGADGSVYIIGIDSVSPTGGYSISKLTGNAFVKMPQCAGTRIAVSPQGVPWVVNKSNLIYEYNGSTNLWDVQSGSFSDIGIGANGSIFAIGTKTVSSTGGYEILQYNGSAWDTLQQCAGVHIAVSPQGVPWVVNKSHIVYKNVSPTLWQAVPGVEAQDIGIGADGSVFVTTTDTTKVNPKPLIYKYNGAGWTSVTGASGVSISVSPTGVPYWVDQSNNVFKLD